MKVHEFNNKKICGKTLVTLSEDNGNFSGLNIGDNYAITGNLRSPFTATNPSQFDYAKYLRNFSTYTTFYAELKDAEEINEDLNVKWIFLQGLNNVRNRILETHARYLKSPGLKFWEALYSAMMLSHRPII